ncbi:hypothetical protein MKZ38_000888 [Zalerion maritima]|uniref:G domain-containing protein n=1 Tax=Zalerion maritima TaxID=339359 RepID=A0AAD5RZW4_9PEZI|nr:hypothetical protein MKZ38_000888 [Zalerion maritima]
MTSAAGHSAMGRNDEGLLASERSAFLLCTGLGRHSRVWGVWCFEWLDGSILSSVARSGRSSLCNGLDVYPNAHNETEGGLNWITGVGGASSSPVVPGLKERAEIGTLYDARRDRFLPASLFRDGAIPDAADKLPIIVSNFDAAAHALGHFEKTIQALGDGRGQPLVYTLLPGGFLVTLGAMISEDAVMSQLPVEHYERTLDFKSCAQARPYKPVVFRVDSDLDLENRVQPSTSEKSPRRHVLPQASIQVCFNKTVVAKDLLQQKRELADKSLMNPSATSWGGCSAVFPPPMEVNILIFGETRVGKSTFVNAFINYLTFSSLDEGLGAGKLNWIIPYSFTTQVVDEKGRLVSKDVVIGADADEADGSKGQSATQQATVYPLYFRDTLIRLTDTPGIGDTRGHGQDGKNMSNVLGVLRNYQDLHGILILLEPNNARLGLMFRFCVKELLTHLHRSAATNMVFGFTKHPAARTTLPGTRTNVYCFDSEPFRYLAARKQSIDMGQRGPPPPVLAPVRRRSRASPRALQAPSPARHAARTLSLNETRHLVARLTAPVQQISTAITDTIARSRNPGARPTGHQADGGGDAPEIPPPPDNQNQRLRYPAPEAQDRASTAWKDHEHILVEYKASLPRPPQKTTKESTAKELRKLKTELGEGEEEEEEAQADTGGSREIQRLHLESNSTTHYNDATAEYLGHLTEDERTRARVR